VVQRSIEARGQYCGFDSHTRHLTNNGHIMYSYRIYRGHYDYYQVAYLSHVKEYTDTELNALVDLAIVDVKGECLNHAKEIVEMQYGWHMEPEALASMVERSVKRKRKREIKDIIAYAKEEHNKEHELNFDYEMFEKMIVRLKEHYGFEDFRFTAYVNRSGNDVIEKFKLDPV
jgi:hypothetical protein